MKRARGAFFPPIAVDRGARTPLHRQIHDWFQGAIVSGRLSPGQPLPSTRALASLLNVSRVPVSSAYEQLQAEGYLQTFVGAGTCVAESIPRRPEPAAADSPATRPDAGERRLSKAARRLGPASQPFRPFRAGAFRASLPDLDHFPIATWATLLAAHARRGGLALMDYGDPMGFGPFREALAHYLGAARGVRCDPSRIMIVSGTQQGLQIVARTLLDPGDAVWMEEPGYPGARAALALAGALVAPIPVDREGLDVAAGRRLCRDARAAYVTPAHQYPLGVTMSAARRVQLLDWAARTGAWIVEDDYDSEYRFAGRPVGALQGIDGAERVIYIGTLSKVLFPALRIAYLVIPEDLVDAFRAIRAATDGFPPTLHQSALAEFIEQGHFARHLRRMRLLYMARRNALVAALDAQVSDRFEIVGAEAGLHLTGLLREGADDVSIVRRGRDAGLSLAALSDCYCAAPTRNGLILGYASANEARIGEGVARLAALIAGPR